MLSLAVLHHTIVDDPCCGFVTAGPNSYHRSMLRSFARLLTVLATCVALASAAASWCAVDCHGRPASPQAPRAAAHCHSAAAPIGTAWQATSSCNHLHDSSWTEAAASRTDPKRQAAAAVIVAANHVDHPAFVIERDVVSNRLLPRSAGPSGFSRPLRV